MIFPRGFLTPRKMRKTRKLRKAPDQSPTTRAKMTVMILEMAPHTWLWRKMKIMSPSETCQKTMKLHLFDPGVDL
jgi:hypothetical protein